MAQEILVGPERRRLWSDGEKIAILVEAAGPDVTVTEVARRHGITRQHIYQRRSDMRRGRLVDETGGPFLAVEFVGGAEDDAAPPEEPDGARRLCEALERIGDLYDIERRINPRLDELLPCCGSACKIGSGAHLVQLRRSSATFRLS